MKPIRALVLLPFPVLLLFAQDVQNTEYVNSSGEKVLRIEFTIPVNRQEAWDLLATADGWKKWAAPVVSVDFRVGGQFLTNYDSAKSVGDPGTIRLPILSYIEGELLILKVILNEQFPEKARQEDKNLQEIIQLVPVGKNQTKIISSMIGWGKGPDWDKTYDFFSRGNAWTYKQLVKLYHHDN
jgi:uncharacterized protein YndB with AHSA1/START domain